MDVNTIFTDTPNDIPANAVCKKAIKNRPYIMLILMLAFFVIGAIYLPEIRIMCIIFAIIVIIGGLFIMKDTPVIEFYDGFVVLHEPKDPDKIAIVPDEKLMNWNIESNHINNIYFEIDNGTDFPDTAVIVTANYGRVTNALYKYYGDLSKSKQKFEAYKEKQRETVNSFFNRKKKDASDK